MKIWTITYNDDYGVRTEICNTEAEAHGRAEAFCAANWTQDEPMPKDWREAYDRLCDNPGFIDSVVVAPHDVSPPAPSELQKVMIEAVPANDDLEVDEDAQVAWGSDPGAFVQTWTWVPFSDVEQDMAIIEESGTVWYFDVFEEFMEAWAGAPATARWERGTPELLEKSEGANDAWEFLTREDRRRGHV